MHSKEADYVEALADNVRRMREAHGLSLSQLSERAGVAKATLFKIERGRTNPTLETMVAVADTFDVSVGSLIALGPRAVVEVVRTGQGEDISDAASDGRVLRSQVIGAGSLEIHAQRFFDGVSETSASHGSGTREHVLIRSGRIRLGPVGDEIEVSSGDYVTYPADRVHRWNAIGGDAELWIVHTFPRASAFVE